MRVDEEVVEVQRLSKFPESIVESTDVVALAQDAGDLGRLDARWHQEQRRTVGRSADQVRDLVGGGLDRRRAMQVVVEGGTQVVLVEAEEDVDAG